MIGVRKTGQLFVSRERQFIEIENAVAPWVNDNLALLVTVNQVADFLQRLAVGQIEQAPSPSPITR
jgi:hypothetical protein